MDQLAVSAVLQKIILGEIDLDEITEVLRSSELVIKSYRTEVENLHRTEESLKDQYEREKEAVDKLTRRLVELHKETCLARDVLRTEIEGKLETMGLQPAVDLEALDVTGLIREREKVQQQMGKVLNGIR
jgi:hypothetical protein